MCFMTANKVSLIICIFFMSCQPSFYTMVDNKKIKTTEIEIKNYNDYYFLKYFSIKPILTSYVDSLEVIHGHGVFNLTIEFAMEFKNNKIPNEAKLNLREI